MTSGPSVLRAVRAAGVPQRTRTSSSGGVPPEVAHPPVSEEAKEGARIRSVVSLDERRRQLQDFLDDRRARDMPNPTEARILEMLKAHSVDKVKTLIGVEYPIVSEGPQYRGNSGRVFAEEPTERSASAKRKTISPPETATSGAPRRREFEAAPKKRCETATPTKIATPTKTATPTKKAETVTAPPGMERSYAEVVAESAEEPVVIEPVVASDLSPEARTFVPRPAISPRRMIRERGPVEERDRERRRREAEPNVMVPGTLMVPPACPTVPRAELSNLVMDRFSERIVESARGLVQAERWVDAAHQNRTKWADYHRGCNAEFIWRQRQAMQRVDEEWETLQTQLRALEEREALRVAEVAALQRENEKLRQENAKLKEDCSDLFMRNTNLEYQVEMRDGLIREKDKEMNARSLATASGTPPSAPVQVPPSPAKIVRRKIKSDTPTQETPSTSRRTSAEGAAGSLSPYLPGYMDERTRQWMTGWMAFQALQTGSTGVPPARGENPGVVYMPPPVKSEVPAAVSEDVVEISGEEEEDAPMEQ